MVFRSRPARGIFSRRPGGIGETGDEISAFRGTGGGKACNIAIAVIDRNVIGIGIAGLLTNGNGPDIGQAFRAVQGNIIGCIAAETGGNGACCAVKDDGLAACGIGAVLQCDFRFQAE